MPRMTTRIVGPTAAGPSRILTCRFAALAAAAAIVAGCAAHAVTPREQAAAAFAELRREIPLRVAEPAQQASLMALADQLEQLVADAAEARAAAAQRLRALHADYDAPRTAIEAALREVRDGNQRRAERALAIRAEAASRLDDASWLEVERFRELTLRAALDLPATAEGAQ
jgi:hypothetical protein